MKDSGVPPGATAATFAMENGASFELAWALAGGDVRATLGLRALKHGPEDDRFLTPPATGATLGDDPAVRALIDPLGPVAGAVVAQPSRAGCTGAPGALVFAWSRRAGPSGNQGAAAPSSDAGGSAEQRETKGQPELMWGEVEASDATLRCVAKML
jgi:hypothetical protein